MIKAGQSLNDLKKIIKIYIATNPVNKGAEQHSIPNK